MQMEHGASKTFNLEKNVFSPSLDTVSKVTHSDMILLKFKQQELMNAKAPLSV